LALVQKTALHKKDADIRAYLYAILRSNPQIVREVLKMTDVDIAFEEALAEAGLIAKWEEKCRREDVKKLLDYGMTPEQVSEALGISMGTVRDFSSK
jgi:hypothetical protein